MVDATDTEFEDAFRDDAAKDARTVKLRTGPNGVSYLLVPKYGSIREIECRRTDGVRIQRPEVLSGGFTDVRSAEAAVDSYLTNRGKAKPTAPNIPVREFTMAPSLLDQLVHDEPKQEAPVGDAEDELVPDPEPEVPVVINASAGTPDPEGETVTQRARREAREALAELEAGSMAGPGPKTKQRRQPLSKSAE